MSTEYKKSENRSKIKRNLRPCPFCGGADIKFHKGTNDCYFQCQDCTTCGPDGADLESASYQWNNRYEDHLREMIQFYCKAFEVIERKNGFGAREIINEARCEIARIEMVAREKLEMDREEEA